MKTKVTLTSSQCDELKKSKSPEVYWSLLNAYAKEREDLNFDETRDSLSFNKDSGEVVVWKNYNM